MSNAPETPAPNTRLRRLLERLPLDPNRPRHFAILAFLEATFVPMPIEVLTAPYMISYTKQAFAMASAMWLGCMTGSLLFYAFGLICFEPIVLPTLQTLGAEEGLKMVSEQLYADSLFWTVLTYGLLPAPLQFASLSTGMMNSNIFVVMSAIAVARAMRYFGLALLARWLGPKIVRIMTSKKFGLATLITTLIASAALVFYLWPSLN